MNNNELWKNWDAEKHYGELFYKQATGESPEMESSKAVSRVIREFYTGTETLLDVGCGSGHYLRSLRNIVSPDIRYSGIDPTAYYIELANKAYEGQANFRTGSIFDIPYGDNSFDIVMCNNVVMHLPPEKIATAFKELVRVTRKKLIVRAMFGERNYIVREVLTTNDLEPGTEQNTLYDNYDLTASKFRYFNMYSSGFYDQLIRSLAGEGISIEFREDRDWKQFNNIEFSKMTTATKTMGSFQVSGNILLDWRFIIMDKL